MEEIRRNLKNKHGEGTEGYYNHLLATNKHYMLNMRKVWDVTGGAARRTAIGIFTWGLALEERKKEWIEKKGDGTEIQQKKGTARATRKRLQETGLTQECKKCKCGEAETYWHLFGHFGCEEMKDILTTFKEKEDKIISKYTTTTETKNRITSTLEAERTREKPAEKNDIQTLLPGRTGVWPDETIERLQNDENHRHLQINELRTELAKLLSNTWKDIWWLRNKNAADPKDNETRRHNKCAKMTKNAANKKRKLFTIRNLNKNRPPTRRQHN